MASESDAKPSLETHGKAAVSEYLRRQPFYAQLAGVTARIIEQCLTHRGVKVHSIQHRAKDPSSFETKAKIPSDFEPERPKYETPMSDITDLAGVRIITYFPDTLSKVDAMLEDEFNILEKSNKGAVLIEEEKFGYQSIHYLVSLKGERARLAEYRDLSEAIAEVQVRTILQHAWAEIEHDIQYKSSHTIPSEIRRRFMALAGMLEIADREFQAIQNADRELEVHAEEMVERGKLAGIEITPNALKHFLDRRLGPDGRISEWSYDWTARLLKQLGFMDLRQVESAISAYDDRRLSTIAERSQLGQTSRFEFQLLAALGDQFIEKHPWQGEWFTKRHKTFLQKFLESGINIGTFDPSVDRDDQIDVGLTSTDEMPKNL
jgi:putative GTP pyrophosphokinase